MGTTHPNNRIEALGKPGAALLARLETLRDGHRLGMHMWEDSMPYSFPSVSHAMMDKWCDVPEKAKLPQISISLLPAKQDGITMQPYGYVLGHFNDAGYLLDLSEDQPNPPTIIAAHPMTMQSRSDPYNKLYREEYRDVTLDMLATRYVTDHAPLKSAEGVAQFNEVLAHIGHPHVAAIVIPSFDDMDYPIENYAALVTFAGCMSALQHAQHAADLPLVCYHVTGARKGEITYVGEGKQQLEKLAVQSLKTIMESKSRKAFELLRLDYGSDGLTEDVQTRLGIDLDKPIEKQRDAFARYGVTIGGSQSR